MKIISTALVILVLSNLLCAETDLSSPKSAYRSYVDALSAGNLETIKSTTINTEKQTSLIEGMVKYSAVEKKFRDVVIKAFPEAAKELPDSSALMLKSIESAKISTEGDSATITINQSPEPVKLKKVEGKWKVDLASMFSDDSVADLVLFRNALSDVMSDITLDVEAGKYKTYADVKNNLEMRVKMRIAMPPDEQPTTRPGN